MIPIARVTEADIKAAAKIKDYAGLLFDPPSSGPAKYINGRDFGAVGTVLTWSRRGSARHEERLLSVIQATGRAHLHRWNGEGRHTDFGVVMLGGEIAARYHFHRLAREFDPVVLAPFAAAITYLWPLPGEEPTRIKKHPRIEKMPHMALLRLTTGLMKEQFATTEIDAMRLLAHALSEGNSPEAKLRCAARICSTVVRYQGRFRGEDLADVRDAVLTARATNTPVALLASASAW
ncbi:hypothetical protein AB0C52_24815 [Streptomyces sp. NPDC048717]|uniref:hypothetical protein n=1 Tax=Streptomyces sp. NPDC048717 TaxID=3154928 RepID=UPI0034315D84